MVTLERWIRCLFLLVVFSAVSLCQGNATITNSTNPTNSSYSGKDSGPLPPLAFPTVQSNGTKIVTSSVIVRQDSSKNSSDPVGKPEPIGTTEVKSNSSITANNNNAKTNTAATDTKSGSANPEIKTDQFKPDESKGAKTTKVNTNTTKPALDSNNSSGNSSKVDTEVGDLLTSPIKGQSANQIPDSPPNVVSNASKQIDLGTELIENGENTEDTLRNSNLTEKLSSPGVPLVQGQLAAILAGVFVIISVTAYVGLLSWRRYLENRYGNRQMLVNEDEFNDDLRHFSI